MAKIVIVLEDVREGVQFVMSPPMAEFVSDVHKRASNVIAGGGVTPAETLAMCALTVIVKRLRELTGSPPLN